MERNQKKFKIKHNEDALKAQKRNKNRRLNKLAKRARREGR